MATQSPPRPARRRTTENDAGPKAKASKRAGSKTAGPRTASAKKMKDSGAAASSSPAGRNGTRQGGEARSSRANAVAGQVGEVLGHAVGSVQVEARRVVADGGKLLHKAKKEACDLGGEAVRRAKAHPWAASGIVAGAGTLLGAAVAGYHRVRGKKG